VDKGKRGKEKKKKERNPQRGGKSQPFKPLLIFSACRVSERKRRKKRGEYDQKKGGEEGREAIGIADPISRLFGQQKDRGRKEEKKREKRKF